MYRNLEIEHWKDYYKKLKSNKEQCFAHFELYRLASLEQLEIPKRPESEFLKERNKVLREAIICKPDIELDALLTLSQNLWKSKTPRERELLRTKFEIEMIYFVKKVNTFNKK